MRVLIVGSGGREHALVWKLKQSPMLTELFVWPGNIATSTLAKILPVDANADFENLASSCIKHKMDLVIVGPETPLSHGITDVLTARGIKVFGPTKLAAQLESSKSFAKSMMLEAGIPTAHFEVCRTENECRDAAHKIFERDGAVVLKASGLAAGKGVFVCQSDAEITAGIKRLYASDLQAASAEVVVEEMLFGRECSYFCFLGQSRLIRLGFAVDHKRLLPGDKGPNTGGMGCYTPVPWLPADAGEQVEAKVVEPLLEALKRHDMPYTGCLYVGVMWSDKGPSVVEFNVRLGDPEAQVLAMSDPSDWLPMMLQQVGVPGDYKPVNQTRRPVMGYVLASSGYPYGEKKDVDATIPSALLAEEANQSVVFQANVKLATGGIVTGSGRVFLVTATGKTFAAARSKALTRIEKIRAVWPECQWRSDIGQSALQQEEILSSSASGLPVILGSSSPRRKELLANLGLEFDVIKPETDEIPRPSELPLDYVQRNASEKNQWICNRIRTAHTKGAIVISADTIVVVGETLLEKPLNVEQAKSMLTMLSGQRHIVYTAVCITKTGTLESKDETKAFVTKTEVAIKNMTSTEMDGYIATGEPFDKAGGYAAQGLGSFMVERIEGSFSNVVGLPLAEVSDILTNHFGIPLWRDL